MLPLLFLFPQIASLGLANRLLERVLGNLRWQVWAGASSAATVAPDLYQGILQPRSRKFPFTKRTMVAKTFLDLYHIGLYY